MKVVVDRAKCTSLGNCEAIAPQYLEVSDEGDLLILRRRLGGCRRGPLVERGLRQAAARRALDERRQTGAHAMRNLLDPASATPYRHIPYFWSDWYGHRIPARRATARGAHRRHRRPKQGNVHGALPGWRPVGRRADAQPLRRHREVPGAHRPSSFLGRGSNWPGPATPLPCRQGRTDHTPVMRQHLARTRRFAYATRSAD